MTAQEMEIRRRRRIKRLRRERQVRRQKRMLATAIITISAIIAGVVSIPQVLVEAPSSTVEVEAKALLPEATEEVIETSTEATEEETSEVEEISGTQVLEGVVVEETTESTETEVETTTEETTEVVEAAEVTEVVESTEVTTASAWMNYTSSDVNLLANIMFAEEGVLYTKYYDTNPVDVETVAKLCGSVVLHRLSNQMYGATTIRDVLYAQGQYAESTKTRIENGQDIPNIFYTWAEDLLRDGPLGPNNLIFQAEFTQETVYATYWNQVFCTSSAYPE